jgi:hypothetical protein
MPDRQTRQTATELGAPLESSRSRPPTLLYFDSSISLNTMSAGGKQYKAIGVS